MVVRDSAPADRQCAAVDAATRPNCAVATHIAARDRHGTALRVDATTKAAVIVGRVRQQVPDHRTVLKRRRARHHAHAAARVVARVQRHSAPHQLRTTARHIHAATGIRVRRRVSRNHAIHNRRTARLDVHAATVRSTTTPKREALKSRRRTLLSRCRKATPNDRIHNRRRRTRRRPHPNRAPTKINRLRPNTGPHLNDVAREAHIDRALNRWIPPRHMPNLRARDSRAAADGEDE